MLYAFYMRSCELHPVIFTSKITVRRRIRLGVPALMIEDRLMVGNLSKPIKHLPSHSLIKKLKGSLFQLLTSKEADLKKDSIHE